MGLGPDHYHAQSLALISMAGGGSLASTSDGNIIANISGISAVPVANPLSAVIDHIFGSTRGNILFRGVSGWASLAEGTAGTILTSGGAGADPSWSSAGAGLTPIPDGDLIGNIAGSSAIPVATTLTTLLDHVFSSTQGMILFRGASAWAALAPGVTGNFLQTNGAGANPSWTAPPASSFLGVFTKALLPAAPVAGSTAHCSDALKVGETTGSGSGCPVYFSSGSWRVFSSDAPVRS